MSKKQRMMPIRKVILLLSLFFIALFLIRTTWYSLIAKPTHSEAVHGVLDLRNWDFQANHVMPLNGEWEFFPSQFLQENRGDKGSTLQSYTMIQVPGTWNATLNPRGQSSYGYGTYRLRILVTPDPKRTYSMYVPSVRSSAKLYINGQLLASSGEPADTAQQYAARTVPFSFAFSSDKGEIEIAIQMANYDHYREGGIIRSIKFGSYDAIEKEKWFSISMQIIVCIVLALHVVYVCILYVIGVRQRALVPFLLLILSAIVMTLADDDKLLLQWLPLDYLWSIKLLFWSHIAVAAFLLHFAKQLLPTVAKLDTLYRLITWLCILSAVSVLLSPANQILSFAIVYFNITLIVCVVLLIQSVHTAAAKDEDALFLALGLTGIIANVIGALIKSRVWPDMGYYPVDLIITFLMFASFWFKRYFRATAQTVELASRLQAADKAKDLFLANTSHELRNPLHGMINIAQSVLEGWKDSRDKKGKESLELLVSVGKRMSYLLNDLLDMTRLRENGIHLHIRELQVQAVTSGVTDMLRFMLGGKNIRLVNAIPDAFPAVMADENRLTQILFNLLHNAVKYTYEGTITLHAAVEGGMAKVYVTDTGIGMDEQTKQRIFLPYQQADADQATFTGGIGLGLSITKQLVELHHGSLEVRSTPGQGSQFCFTLPLAGVQQQERVVGYRETATTRADNQEIAAAASADLPGIAAAVSPPHSARTGNSTAEALPLLTSDRPNVLAIDDDPINLNVLVSLLSPECCQIVTAASGKEALTLLDTRNWDLVISDVMMPGMSGYELSRLIRERFTMSELPILLLTARSQPEDIQAGFMAGANDYVTKPVDAQELRSRVRALTEMKKSVRERLQLEASWLQAQIQPHFLFNTLNAITALSSVDPDRMNRLLEAFSNYLRASFNFKNSERFVPLAHELDLVRSYLYIEKERFEDRLDIRWDVDESLDLLIPPLTIQPLVENAVRHGILNRLKGGKVQIRIADKGEYTEISVMDDGVGMSEEKRKGLLDARQHQTSGIGIANTDRRLRQAYGKGLEIDSEPAKGTTVRFFVPN
ncbi:ATP-binding protein [Brevibacillus sp. B_LB10_24]|uniref:hybrid sensor histidine kinase/response regulator n=1 Tax=Brevibacillus sp. B_LB10_24 TaxID=3380645 RepID=UPI0038B9AC0C